MGKAVGIIGNFSGKLGNAVGFKNSASNDGRTQGVRIYQPVVKNPKTYAQAAQRALMLPVNVTYRGFKDIIDRGQEGISYGNKSRLAWLKKAMKQDLFPCLEKGSTDVSFMPCELTHGTLGPDTFSRSANVLFVFASISGQAPDLSTVGKVSTILLANNANLKEGDQLTLIGVGGSFYNMKVDIFSMVLKTDDNTAVSGFSVSEGVLTFNFAEITGANWGGRCAIISREGAGGAHQRSTSKLQFSDEWRNIYDDDEDPNLTLANAQKRAIRSYMTSGSNVDWPQEEISPNL